MFRSTLIYCLILLCFYACDDDTTEIIYQSQAIDKSRDFIVFGEIYGACTGSCRSLYLLYDDGLYIDVSKQEDPLKESFFSSSRLDEAQFLDVLMLLSVPESVKSSVFPDSSLVDYIEDVDTYVYGKISGVEFEYGFDAIELEAETLGKEYLESIHDAWLRLQQ